MYEIIVANQNDSSQFGDKSLRFIGILAGIFKASFKGFDFGLSFSKSTSLSAASSKQGFIFLLIRSC